jgi:AmmeMemoRadiSam system protein B
MLISTTMILVSCNNGTKEIEEKKINVDEVIARPPLLDSSKFIDERVFIKSINESTLIDEDNDIIAGIIPHHDVANSYIASLYKTIANKKQPQLIILIGPNHPGIGPRFQIGNYDFNTRAGVIKSDSNIINNLANHEEITYAIEEVFKKEHSVGLHMNYIKQYFDETIVDPITIGETRNDEGILDVAKAIAKEIKDKDFVIIASIDFSHYLTLEEANEKDKMTRKIIEESDVDRMIGLGNDHIDSP